MANLILPNVPQGKMSGAPAAPEDVISDPFEFDEIEVLDDPAHPAWMFDEIELQNGKRIRVRKAGVPAFSDLSGSETNRSKVSGSAPAPAPWLPDQNLALTPPEKERAESFAAFSIDSGQAAASRNVNVPSVNLSGAGAPGSNAAAMESARPDSGAANEERGERQGEPAEDAGVMSHSVSMAIPAPRPEAPAQDQTYPPIKVVIGGKEREATPDELRMLAEADGSGVSRLDQRIVRRPDTPQNEGEPLKSAASLAEELRLLDGAAGGGQAPPLAFEEWKFLRDYDARASLVEKVQRGGQAAKDAVGGLIQGLADTSVELETTPDAKTRLPATMAEAFGRGTVDLANFGADAKALVDSPTMPGTNLSINELTAPSSIIQGTPEMRLRGVQDRIKVLEQEIDRLNQAGLAFRGERMLRQFLPGAPIRDPKTRSDTGEPIYRALQPDDLMGPEAFARLFDPRRLAKGDERSEEIERSLSAAKTNLDALRRQEGELALEIEKQFEAPEYRAYRAYVDQVSRQAARAIGEDGAGNVVPKPLRQTMAGVIAVAGPFAGSINPLAAANAEPMTKTAESLSTVLEPSILGGPLFKAARLAAAPMKAGAKVAAKVAAAVERAGETGSRIAGRLANAAGKLNGPVGKALSMPAKAAGSAADLVSKVGKIGGAVVNEAAKPSQFGVLERLARDASQPDWLRKAAGRGVLVEKTAASVARHTAPAAKGGLIGGVMAAVSDGSPESIGAGIGSGAAMGLAGGVAHGIIGSKARSQAEQDADALWFLQQSEARGNAAGRIAKELSRDELVQAATMQRAMPGLEINFVDGDTFARASGQAGQAGWYDPENRQIWMNLDAKRPAGRTFTHELTEHVQREVGKDGSARDLMYEVYGEDGLRERGRAYARRYLESAAAARGMPPGSITPEMIDRQVQRFREQRGGDRAYDWVASEVFAEHGVSTLTSKDLNRVRQLGRNEGLLRENMLRLQGKVLRAFGIQIDPQTGKIQSDLFGDALIKNPKIDALVKDYVREHSAWKASLDQASARDLGDGTRAGAKLTFDRVRDGHPGVEWRSSAYGSDWEENDFAVRNSATGEVWLKRPEEIRQMEQSRAQAFKQLISGEEKDSVGNEFGWKVQRNGQVSGWELPEGWDNLEAFPEDVRLLARFLEGARTLNESVRVWYQQLGDGADVSLADSVQRGKLDGVEVSERELAFLGWSTSKSGQPVARMLDVGAARKRMLDLAEQGKLKEWEADLKGFDADLKHFLGNLVQGLPAEANGIGKEKGARLHQFLGEIDPLADERGGSLVKGFRLDRLVEIDIANSGGIFSPDATRPKGPRKLRSDGKTTKWNGLITEPDTPPKIIVAEQGIKIENRYKSNDHGPAHLHLVEGDNEVKIGQAGKPIKGESELTAAQRKLVEAYMPVIEKAIRQIERYYWYNTRPPNPPPDFKGLPSNRKKKKREKA